MEGLMTIEEASAYLKLSRGALAKLRYEGRGPRYLKPRPKTVLYRKSDIDEWLEASVRTGTAKEAA